ncbi:MAG: threonine/serine dehydratase [Euryarchaeota archaeon]|nr:threonine/serine dehydratase [Euryarchaeota archaeon]
MDRIAVTRKDVETALPIVREVAVRTPTILHEDAGREVFLKLENLQRLGVFKIRGTWNRLSLLSDEERRRGVATISSGNHGLSLAWAAKRLGIPCLVRVPEGAVGRKVDAIRSLGAQVAPMPRDELVRVHEEELWRSWPQTFIHPFAHAHTIAGQGTAGWEIADDVPDVRTVLVPVGGGGLATGIAVAVKGRQPKAKVYAVQAEGAASFPVALRTGRPHRIANPRTIADGIRIGIVLPNMVDILRRNLDGCLVVSDDEIRAAMRRLALEAKVVAEPAGAAAFAAWVRYRQTLEPSVVAVISGGNVDPELFASVVGPTA